jgi:hypothetical protein
VLVLVSSIEHVERSEENTTSSIGYVKRSEENTTSSIRFRFPEKELLKQGIKQAKAHI